jgi:hypothetical protein
MRRGGNQRIRHYVLVAVCGVAVAGCGFLNPHREVEADARPSETHPLAGFWKSPGCGAGAWGLAIGPMEPTTYYVSFCGPGGCFAKGAYRAVTTLYNDPHYRVIDANTLEMEGSDGFTKYVRCAERRAAGSPRNSDDALYAAEAGLEFGQDELIPICNNPEVLQRVRVFAASRDIPFPGHGQGAPMEGPWTAAGGFDPAATREYIVRQSVTSKECVLRAPRVDSRMAGPRMHGHRGVLASRVSAARDTPPATDPLESERPSVATGCGCLCRLGPAHDA